MYEVYLITCTVNGKRYVGQTSVGYEKRFQEHLTEARLNPSGSILHRAINKYGPEAFTVKRILKNIEECDIDRYEKLWITKLNTFVSNGQGYNMTRGGQGVHGYIHTDETKRKLSQSLKGKPLNHGDKIKAGFIRNNSMQHRREKTNWRSNLSATRMGRFTESDNPFYGKHHTDEVKAYLSQIHVKPVEMLDTTSNEVLRTFNSLDEASKWVISEGRTNNKWCNARISEICLGKGQTAYGYRWRYKIESVTTIPDECKEVE